MGFTNLINERYSVRGYKSTMVEDEKLQQILEAARMAPTAANRQPFVLYVIKTEGKESDLRRIYAADWFIQAPYIICACAIPSQAWVRASDNKNYVFVDVAIMFDHLVLAAHDLGLGTCWIAAFDPQAAREILGLPEEHIPVVFTPIGYPDKEARSKVRKELSELVHYMD
ncbi:MAG: nitroreductase family protein [Anaerolineaceae bacterium]|nr:nitroreductase family protein [Anaerolineaceae bacterium]